MMGKSGRFWEEQAEKHLTRRGLKLLKRNYFCAAGELDLIMWDGAVMVFVEVKYRSSDAFGSPAEAVTRKKLAKLRAAAAVYISQTNPGVSEFRFDVVAIGRGRIQWLKGVHP